jgi:hypothetical protein
MTRIPRPLSLTIAAVAVMLSSAAPAALAAQRPAVDEQSVSGLTQTSVILNATLNTQGQATTYHFQYVTQTAFEATGYTNALSIPVPGAQAGSARGETVVGQQLAGLEPATAYRYRVIATNASGTEEGREGEDETFTTPPQPLPPLATTTPALGVSQNTATLSATIDARGIPTSYEFDIGPDTGYGTRIFGQATPSEGPRTYTATLQALEAGATYHYRIVATDAYATSYGEDQTFTTATYPTSLLSGPVTLSLIPAPAIGPAPAAKGAAARAASHTARHARAKAATGKRRRHGNGRHKAGESHTPSHRDTQTRDERQE